MLYGRWGKDDVNTASCRLFDAKRLSIETKPNGYSYDNYQNGEIGGRAGKYVTDKKFSVDLFVRFSFHDKKNDRDQRNCVSVSGYSGW